jgi:hypothetical protein
LVPEFRLFRLSHRVAVVSGGSGLAPHVDSPSFRLHHRHNPYPCSDVTFGTRAVGLVRLGRSQVSHPVASRRTSRRA